MIFVCFELPDDLFVDLFVGGVGLPVRVSDSLFSIVLLYHEKSRKSDILTEFGIFPNGKNASRSGSYSPCFYRSGMLYFYI